MDSINWRQLWSPWIHPGSLGMAGPHWCLFSRGATSWKVPWDCWLPRITGRADHAHWAGWEGCLGTEKYHRWWAEILLSNTTGRAVADTSLEAVLVRYCIYIIYKSCILHLYHRAYITFISYINHIILHLYHREYIAFISCINHVYCIHITGQTLHFLGLLHSGERKKARVSHTADSAWLVWPHRARHRGTVSPVAQGGIQRHRDMSPMAQGYPEVGRSLLTVLTMPQGHVASMLLPPTELSQISCFWEMLSLPPLLKKLSKGTL